LTENNGSQKRLPLDPLLLGLYTWLSTVAVPSFTSDASPLSRWLSIATIVPLIVAWWLAVRFPLVADYVLGIGFVGLSFATWMTLGHARLASNLAELRTAIGAFAWALFAIAWVRTRQAVRLLVSQDPTRISRKGGLSSLGVIGSVQLGIALLLVFAVFWMVGLPNGNGRGALVTSLALGWAIWLLDTSGLLAARLEHQRKGLGFGLFKESAMLVALGLAGVGLLFSRTTWP